MEKEVTETEMLEAQKIVEDFIERLGGDKYDFDWEDLPADTPEFVRQAVETYGTFWEQCEAKGIQP